MLIGSDLTGTLARLPGIDIKARFFRVVAHRHLARPSPTLLYSQASVNLGARYTTKGVGPLTTYLASDMPTALSETEALIPQAHGSATGAGPWVIGAVDVELRGVLDLTDSIVCQALMTTAVELRKPWRLASARGGALTQILGQAVFDSGRFVAVRYESTKHPGGTCLAVFDARLQPSQSNLEVFDDSGLLSQRLP